MSKKINEFVLLRPWAMKQETLLAMSQIIERHLRGEKLSESEIAARIGKDKREPTEYDVVGNVAVIPVYGIIAKRANLVGGISQPQGTSVEQIQKDFLAAVDDPAVSTVLLDIDSPGGSVGGVSELADLIYASRGKKRIIAFANGQMDSAAYWIGSSADEIFASNSAEIGSIGVYTILSDYSVWYHNEGIKKQIIKAGKFKAAGDPSKPLTDDEKAIIQEEIDSYYELFVDAVARNRSINRGDVLALADGRVYIGKKALDAGLIDDVRTFESFFSVVNVGKNKSTLKTTVPQRDDDINLSQTKTSEEDKSMGELTVEKLKAENKPLADALMSEGKAAGLEEGKSQGRQEALNEEKARVAGIIGATASGAEKLALEAIKDGSTSEAFKDKLLKAMQDGTIKSVGPDNPDARDATDKAKQDDAQGKNHLERARAYQKEHKCSLAVALQETASKRTK